MLLEHDFWQGNLDQVKNSLIRSVAQYTRNHHVKIGITNDPKNRFFKHLKGSVKWRKMIVKYTTSSELSIREMERIIVDYHWDYLENRANGTTSRKGKGPYYLYLLLS